MISSKDVKIPFINDLTSEYIETELIKQSYDVLRWAITNCDENTCTINIAYVE